MRLSPAFWALIFGLGCGGSSSGTEESATDSAIDSAVADGSIDDTSADSELDAGADSVSPSDSTAPGDSGSPSDSSASETGAGTDPSVPGTHEIVVSTTKVGTTNAHLVVPKGAPPVGGWPAVVFAHGFQLTITSYDDILKHVASHGFVVLSVDFPGSLFSIDHRDVRDAIVKGRAAVVADMVTGAPKVDPTKIAAMGHSLGGKGAVWAAITDTAFAAVLALDPVDGSPSPGGGPTEKTPVLAPTETAKLTQPVGYFGTTQSRCLKLGQSCAPETLDAAHFFAGTSGTKYLWTVFDFGHMQFLDDPTCAITCTSCTAGTSPIPPRKKAVKGIAVAFLRRHLLAESAFQPWLDGTALDTLESAKSIWDGKIAKPACP